MVGFNLAVLGAVDHMGATNTGVIVGASPVLLALAAATRDPRLLACAVIVVAGAVIVNGADARLSAIGTAARPHRAAVRGRLHPARRAAAAAPRPATRRRLGRRGSPPRNSRS